MAALEAPCRHCRARGFIAIRGLNCNSRAALSGPSVLAFCRVNGPGYPYYHQPPPPPPPPPRRGPSPVVIVLLVVGGVFALGGGACVVLGGLAVLGASADADPATAEGDAPGLPTATAPPTATAAPTATSLVETGHDEPAPDATGATNGDVGPPTTGARPPATGTAGGGTWSCTASGSVRVCGFANACNNQMVFGNGFGKDRYLASTQAKNACESMARAKGGSTVCVVQCSVR
jgi:hypothetical protein